MRSLVTTLTFFFVVGVAPMAMAQAANTLVAEGLSLPKDHQYEQYNAAAGSYGKVDVSQVPALVKKKQPIYDRTAKAWVYQSPQGLNPKYATGTAAAPAAPAPAAPAPAATASAPAPSVTAPAATTPGAGAPAPLVADGLTLPRDRQYERYDKASGTYSKVDVNQVPALVKQKVPIYDRTAKAWVFNSEQKIDPRYAAAAPGAAATPTSTPPAASTVTTPAVTPPAAATPLAASRLTLPRDHQYERFNPGTSTYAKVDVSQVPGLVEQRVPIYDRTAKAWVLNTEHKLDPRYGTTFSAIPLSSLPAGQSLTLPKDHQYERYDLASATYRKIDVNQVPTLVQQKTPVFDRTAKAWVLDTEQQVDSRYLAAPGQTTTASSSTPPASSSTPPASSSTPQKQSGEWQRIHGKVESIKGSTLTFRADDGRVLTVDVSKVDGSIQRALTPGEGATVITHEWTGPNKLRANYVQQDSSDPSRGGKTPSASGR